jgi:glycosyltransferase involved in cell wall biosynthesis
MTSASGVPRPVASVLFLAYNHEAFVEDALRSALRQDVGGFELVIVDDASTDRTRARIEQVLARETPAGVSVRRIFKEQNEGLLCAVNAAMAAATGDIFLLMAGDDLSLPCRLGRTLRIFAGHPSVQLVYGGRQTIDEAGRPRGSSSSSSKQPRRFSYGRARLGAIYAEASPFGASAAYRRRLFDFFGPMGAGTHGEDNCYWVRALLLGEIHREPAVFIQWRQHSGNLSNFTSDVENAAWRRRHLVWMQLHATMSPQWLQDIARARSSEVISPWRAFRLSVAALREDRSWALAASSLRVDPWGRWLGHGLRLLLTGRFSTTIRQFKVRISRRRQERTWRFWAKLKTNPVD